MSLSESETEAAPTLAQRATETEEPIADLVREFYGPGGPLAAAGWDIRSGQVEMSMDIAEAYDAGEGWLVHEAPCGTGKGLAYLVPGILIAFREHAIWSATDEDKRSRTPPQCVVSTANIALQEQLIQKDIPAIAEMLQGDVRSRLLKGRNNYVCRKSIHVVDESLLTYHEQDFSRLMSSLEDGWDGDKESLSWDPGKMWGKVSRTSRDCTGNSCSHFALGSESPCYWRKAIVGWERAHVLVVNHHLLALKRMNACLIAVDEMHELEAAVRSAVSERLTTHAGRVMANRAKSVIGDEAEDMIAIPIARIMDSVERDFSEANPRRTRWPDPVVLKDHSEHHARDVASLWGAADILRADALSAHGCFDGGPGQIRGRSGNEESGRAANTANAAHGLAQRAEAVASGRSHPDWPGDPWALYAEGWWTDRQELRVTAHAAPADVSWAIARMREAHPVACFTSATVPDFKSLRLTFGIGVEEDDEGWAAEKRLASPYDLPSMGVAVVPNGPGPKDHTWPGWAADQVVDAVAYSGGGALVLASSIKQMKAYGEALRANLPQLQIRVQGEEGRGVLREWFGREQDGVLVATRSFFQGLDVQGDSCRLVIIDRIPFARPGDPVEAAIQALLVSRAGGGSGYMLRSIPDAAMTLAQGAGRLIRAHSDRGAVVVLDKRILGSGAGWAALKRALPPFKLSRSLTDVRAILNGEDLQGVPEVRGRAITGRRW